MVKAEQPQHTRLIRGRKGQLSIERRLLRVQVKAGPDKGLRSDLSEERIVIGTHPGCQVALNDPTISRQHCELVLGPRGYVLRDLDSTNGLFLGALRLSEVTLTEPLTVTLGNTELAISPRKDTVELEASAEERFGPLIGRSAAMRRIFAELARLAVTDMTALILGESGTGKEVTARAIHEASRRRHGPFRVVDCGSLPATLIESELFGHVRGAFTGADKDRQGAFADADGGSLFLDELGELPLDLQTRLLGVLERRCVTPLGSNKRHAVDVRVIAATNRNLRREINQGTFREDLFYRIAVGVIELPPLRDRPEDIPLYVEHFLEGEPPLDQSALAKLAAQPWPGNVRELRNAIERLRLIGDVPDYRSAAAPPAELVGSLSFEVNPAVDFKVAKALLIGQFEQPYIKRLMALHAGNITQAAKGAGLDRVHLLRLLDKFGMRGRNA